MERRSVLRILALFFSQLCIWGKAESFNVDIRNPIMRVSPTLVNGQVTDAATDDFFGFSFALHQVEVVAEGDGREEAARKTRILVGAPKGTFPGGLNLTDEGTPALSNTGLLYSCAVIPGVDPPCNAVTPTNDPADVNNDGMQAGGRLFDQRPNARLTNPLGSIVQAEQKSGQLLGATVYSNGERVVVCAPAWVSSGPYSLSTPSRNALITTNALPQGRCYYTGRDLSNVEFLDPCNSFDDTSDVRGDINQGYCTAGTSATVLSTPTPRFVIGTPGYDRGIGALFYGSNDMDVQDRMDRSTIGRGNIEHEFNGTLSEIVETSQGFQVVTGYITRRRDTATLPNVLASVHRYDNSDYTGRVDVYDADDIQTLLSVTAEGTQIAEFFGYSLVTADLNNDEYDDVIVGAPMYTDFEPTSLRVEAGRVYVFMNTGSGNLSTVPTALTGTVARGRFGMSLLNLGDIDRDGFEDFAVGAPYEAVGDSTGVVYIYYGTSGGSFDPQEPGRVTGQSIADRLMGVNSLNTFGFSLASQDVDNNKYNDLAIGAFESRAVVLLRSLPVANVVVTLTPTSTSIKRLDRTCDVGGTFYACIDVTVGISFNAVELSEIDVTVVVSEIPFEGRPRVFFGANPTQSEQSVTVSANTTGSNTAIMYLLNNIVDSTVPLELSASVQQNALTEPSSPGNGSPAISDLSSDFRIRLPAPAAMATVNLTNNCGDEQPQVCQTDFSFSTQPIVTYLPEGQNYQSIEEGGVDQVRVQLSLANTGMEDAIELLLSVSHNVTGVFDDEFDVIFLPSDASRRCTLGTPCNVRELPVDGTMNVVVQFSVATDPPVGPIMTTFTLTSMTTMDTNANNNVASVVLMVERRADLKVAVSFPQETTTYPDVEPTIVVNSRRDDVGMSVLMEVRVENVRSTTVNKAELKIYYPARAEETGDFFYLLPDCSVTPSLSMREGSITCDNPALQAADALQCNGASGRRRKRHTVSPLVKQRRRQAGASGSLGRALHRTPRQQMSTLDCSTNPESCLLVTCNITELRGQSENLARLTLTGYVDNRFFFDKSENYQLVAYATVSFDSTAEGTTDQMQESDDDSGRFSLNPLSRSTDSESSTLTIIVIVVIVVGSIFLIVVVAVILYFLGFFRRKKKTPEEEPEDGPGVTVTETTGEKPPERESTTL